MSAAPEQDAPRIALVFIHGLLSNGGAWNPLLQLLRADEGLQARLCPEIFEYNTRIVGNKLLTRIPTYRTIADKLRTEFARYCESYDGVVFVTHSQGGLVLQTFLSRMLADGMGESLQIIRRIVLIACPNGGSGIFLAPRRLISFFAPNIQERRLRPLDEEVADAHRHVSLSIDRATTVSPATCPIPVTALAAESDGIVPRPSAYGSFHTCGVLAGTHSSVIRPLSQAATGYQAIRRELAIALNWPAQSPARSARRGTAEERHVLANSARTVGPHQDASAESRPKNNLPRRTASRLIGRETEAARLVDVLRREPGAQILVDGYAGCGKTTLALAICHDMLHDAAAGFDAIIWLSGRTSLWQVANSTPTSESSSDLDDLTATMALTLDRPDLIHLSPRQRAAGLPAAMSGARCLVVLDNYETISDPRVLPYMCDLPQSCCLLVTSRQRVDLPHRVHLAPLPTEAAAELASLELARREMPSSRVALTQLAAASGGLPLAITWLVGRRAMGAPHLAPSSASNGEDGLLRQLFESGIGQLSEPGEILPMLVLAHPPGTVPSSVLTRVLAGLGMADGDMNAAISALCTLNLIEYDIESDRYGVLAVTKRFLLSFSGDHVIPNESVFTEIANAYAEALTWYLTRESDVLWSAGYAQNAWDRDRTNAFVTIQGCLRKASGPQAVELLNALYSFAITFGHFNEFLEMSDAALGMRQDVEAAAIVALLARRSSILVHSGQADLAAVELDRAEAIFKQLLAVSDELTNLMYFVRGIVAISLNAPEAEPLLQAAIAFEERRGVDWARLGFQGWLGLYLVQAGRLDEADDVLTRTREECMSIGDLRTTVFVHVGLARLQLARAEYQDLIATAPEVLALAEQFGEDHNRAHLRLAIATACCRMRQQGAALRHASAAREMYLRLGAHHEVRHCEDLLTELGVG